MKLRKEFYIGIGFVVLSGILFLLSRSAQGVYDIGSDLSREKIDALVSGIVLIVLSVVPYSKKADASAKIKHDKILWVITIIIILYNLKLLSIDLGHYIMTR